MLSFTPCFSWVLRTPLRATSTVLTVLVWSRETVKTVERLIQANSITQLKQGVNESINSKLNQYQVLRTPPKEPGSSLGVLQLVAAEDGASGAG
jgi:hypothetical protein